MKIERKKLGEMKRAEPVMKGDVKHVSIEPTEDKYKLRLKWKTLKKL